MMTDKIKEEIKNRLTENAKIHEKCQFGIKRWGTIYLGPKGIELLKEKINELKAERDGWKAKYEKLREELEGVTDMQNEKIIKDIDEIIMTNRIAKTLATTEMEKDSFRKSNDVLSRARTVIKNIGKEKQDAYNEGLNDAWGLAQKIFGHNDGCLRPIDVRRIFGNISMSVILSDHTYTQALVKVQEYEKKKEEETKPVVGDLVKIVGKYDGSVTYVGIVMSTNDTGISILTKDYGAIHLVNRNNAAWDITKLNKHFDIEELLEAMDEK